MIDPELRSATTDPAPASAAPPQGVKVYPGAALTVTFETGLCRHAAECVRGLPEVFNPQARPWILPDAADPAAVAEVIGRCPSGALKYTFPDSGSEVGV